MGSMVILMATHGKSWGAGFFMGIGPKLDSPLPFLIFPPNSGPLGHYPTTNCFGSWRFTCRVMREEEGGITSCKDRVKIFKTGGRC